MNSQVDLIYDRLIAQEKLKDGTKYERLAAIAFSLLTGRETVHDLRLLGASGVRHQIDAVIGQTRKRVLVETKDYDQARKIGLAIIRNFWGAVEDIGPDESFVVTTVGFTAPAITYADAKGIRLALLRPPEEENWQGIYRKVVLDIIATGQTGLANITWQLHPDDHGKINGESTGMYTVETRQLKLADSDGNQREFFPIFDAQFAEDYGRVPVGAKPRSGVSTSSTSRPRWSPPVEHRSASRPGSGK